MGLSKEELVQKRILELKKFSSSLKEGLWESKTKAYMAGMIHGMKIILTELKIEIPPNLDENNYK